MKLVFFQPGEDFFAGLPRFLHLNCVRKKQALSHGGTAGIDHTHGALAVFFIQLFGGKARAVVAAAERGGKADMEHAFSVSQEAFKEFFRLHRRCLLCLRHFPAPHLPVKFLRAHILPEAIANALHCIGKDEQAHIMSQIKFFRHIAGIIAGDHKAVKRVHTASSLSADLL